MLLTGLNRYLDNDEQNHSLLNCYLQYHPKEKGPYANVLFYQWANERYPSLPQLCKKSKPKNKNPSSTEVPEKTDMRNVIVIWPAINGMENGDIPVSDGNSGVATPSSHHPTLGSSVHHGHYLL